MATVFQNLFGGFCNRPALLLRGSPAQGTGASDLRQIDIGGETSAPGSVIHFWITLCLIMAEVCETSPEPWKPPGNVETEVIVSRRLPGQEAASPTVSTLVVRYSSDTDRSSELSPMELHGV